MLTQVCIEHRLYDHVPCLFLQVQRHIFNDVAFGRRKHYLERSSEVVVLEHTLVGIPYREWVFGTDDKLVAVAGMLEVVHETGDEC